MPNLNQLIINIIYFIVVLGMPIYVKVILPKKIDFILKSKLQEEESKRKILFESLLKKMIFF